MITLGTERLRLRPMRHDDLDDMAALLGDPEVMAYYPRPKDRDEARAWISWTLDSYARHGHGLWVVESRATGEFYGDCGLTVQDVDGVDELEVGYHVHTRLQGRGIATEAARASLGFAAGHLGAGRVVAIIHPDNLASQRVAEKVGLPREKVVVRPDSTPVVVHAGAPG